MENLLECVGQVFIKIVLDTINFFKRGTLFGFKVLEVPVHV